MVISEVKKMLQDAAKNNKLNLTFTDNTVILDTGKVKITLTHYGIWYAERK